MSEHTSVRSTSPASAVAARRRTRLVAVGASVAGALLIWLIAVPALGVELRAPAGPGSTELQPVPFFSVLISSLFAPLAGWALLAGLERVTDRARTIWTAIAVLVLLVSYGGPLLGAGVPIGSRITLALMHTAVGLAVIPAFSRSSPRR